MILPDNKFSLHIHSSEFVCEKLRDGGCPNSGAHHHHIKNAAGRMSIEACREQCRQTPECAIYFHGKPGAEQAGVCTLWKQTAVDGCEYREAEKDLYAMYPMKCEGEMYYI